MTEEERLEIVLGALRGVLLAAAARGVAEHVVLIGAQVVALEQRRRGQRSFITKTNTGIVIPRPFSHEPDLLFDPVGAGPYVEELAAALRAEGFTKVSSWRWTKDLGSFTIAVDVLEPVSPGQEPGAVDRIRSGAMALARARERSIPLAGGDFTVRLPDAASFLRLKLDARGDRNTKTGKDAFDLYAYLTVVPPEEVRRSLSAAPEGPEIRAELARLFATPDSSGVVEVLGFAGLREASLDLTLARDVVDRVALVLPESDQ